MIASASHRGPLRWSQDGAAWPHARHSRFVAAGGSRWHVQVITAPQPGAPVLWLLHGTGAASHSWRNLVPLLADVATLVLPDLPGHGFSSRLPAAEQSLAGMARALAALATALGLPPSLAVGHSAGAALAARAVLDGAWPAVPLLGVNAALRPFSGPAAPLAAPLARWLSRRTLLPALLARRAADAQAVARLVGATGSRLDATGVALYARLLRSPEHLAGALAMMGGWDLHSLWRELPRLPQPLTLLVGLADATVAPAQATAVQAACPGTLVLTRPGLGHLAHEEDPHWLAELLRPALVAAAASAGAPG